jgi:hypothetical protein
MGLPIVRSISTPEEERAKGLISLDNIPIQMEWKWKDAALYTFSTPLIGGVGGGSH